MNEHIVLNAKIELRPEVLKTSEQIKPHELLHNKSNFPLLCELHQSPNIPSTSPNIYLK